MQVCDAEDVKTLKGGVRKDHGYIHIASAPSKSISDIVKRLKGRSSRILQMEYPELKKHSIGVSISGQSVMEFGVQAILQTRWCKNILTITVILQTKTIIQLSSNNHKKDF